MKRKFMLFGIVQIVFFVLFYFSTLLYAGDTRGLAPFNSGLNLTQVNLSEPTSVEKLKKLAKDEKLNISLYDDEKKEFYIYFADAAGPSSVFGVPGEQFVYDQFGADGCASTDVTKGCALTLSSPNKEQQISIRSLDRYAKKDEVDTIVVYPSEGTLEKNARDVFTTVYPKATFMGTMTMTDRTVYIPYLFFCIISILVLLSITQQMYKEGKERGVQTLFGWNTFERTMLPFIAMISTIVILLIAVYLAIYHYITFDWAFIWPAAMYCTFITIFAVVWLGYHQWNIHKRPVNVLMKGFLGSKLLSASYIVLSVGFLALSGAMMPLLSQTTRDMLGRSEILSRYETELKNSGTVNWTNAGGELIMKRDAHFQEKNAQVMQHVSEYLEYKSDSVEYYYPAGEDALEFMFQADEETPGFRIFKVNQNFVVNRLSSQFKDTDVSDESVLYVFSKDPSAQAKEIEALKRSPMLTVFDEAAGPDEHGHPQSKPPVLEVIKYDNDAVSEYVNDTRWSRNGPGKPRYVEIPAPIYVVQGGKENFSDYDGYGDSFAYSLGTGYYMPLRDERARQVWDTIPTFLAEIGASEYFEERTTFAERAAESLAMERQALYIMASFSLISLTSGIALIMIFLQAFFRSQRKQLVLKRLFGRSFVARFGVMFALVSFALISCWVFVTFVMNEWELFNATFIGCLLIIVLVAMRIQIGRLEAAAMNSVIKE